MPSTPRVAFKEVDDDSIASVDDTNEKQDIHVHEVEEDELEQLGELPESSVSHVQYSTNPRPPHDPLKVMRDTLDMLNISTLTMTEDEAILLFKNIQSLGKEKYMNKTILGHENALSKLLVLFTKYNSNISLVVEGCKAMSQMTINDTDNKKTLGADNACQELVTVITLHADKLDVLVHCFTLVVNLCNSTFQYKLPSISPIHQPGKVVNSMDFHTCNNRINFMDAGLFPLILSAMKAVNASSASIPPTPKANQHAAPHPHEALILVTCRMISTLAENDIASKALGEAEMCGVVTKLLSLNKYSEIVCAAAYSLIMLCSDNKAGNKMRFNMFGVLDVIINNLKEYILKVTRSSVAPPDFHMLMDRLCWCLANLTLSCPKNVSDLRSQHQSKDVLETLMGSMHVKDTAKQKAMVVFKRVFPQYCTVVMLWMGQ